MICRTAPFSMTLNDPYPRFQVAGCQKKHTLIELAALKENKLHNYTLTKLKKKQSRAKQLSLQTNLHMPYNDTKRRAVSLRQLSFTNSQLRNVSISASYNEIESVTIFMGWLSNMSLAVE